MTHGLTIRLTHDWDEIDWAQATVKAHHYLHRMVDYRARPMTYIIKCGMVKVGLVMLGIPHATRCKGWWGYKGLPSQWQVVDLCRVWLSPVIQTGGYWCNPELVPGFTDRKGSFRPTVATWAIREVLAHVQADRVRMWPPVYPEQPYHIRLAISYSDPQYHRGTIYRQAGALPMYVTDGQPVPGSSGKYGWCWQLPEPTWTWHELVNIRPRTMRMEFS